MSTPTDGRESSLTTVSPPYAAELPGSRRTARLTIDIPDGQIAVQAAQPLLVSQKTSVSVMGLPSRSFLAAVKAYRASGGEVAEWGRLRLVDRADFVRWLSARNATPKPDDGAESLAAELGLTLVGGVQ